MRVIKAVMAVCLGVCSFLCPADPALEPFAEETLVPHFFIDSDVGPESASLLAEIQAMVELYKSNPQAAEEKARQLLQQLTPNTPVSLRRQLRQTVCDAEDARQRDQLLLLSAEWLQHAEQLAPEEHASYLLCQSNLHFAASRHKEAFTLLAEAHKVMAEYPDSIVSADLMLSHGYMSSYLGDVQAATELLLKSRNLYVALRYGPGVGSADLYLAHIYRYTNQTAIAREIYSNLLRSAQTDGNQSVLTLLYHSLAHTYVQPDEVDIALEYLRKGLIEAEKQQSITGQAHTHMAISRFLETKGEFAVASEHAERAKYFAEVLDSTDLMLRVELALIELALRNNVDDALLMRIDNVFNQFKSLDDFSGMMDANGYRLTAQRKMKRFEEALATADIQFELAKQFEQKNSLESTERMRAAHQLERRIEENTRLKTQHAHTESELAQAQSIRHLQWLILLLAGLLILLVVIWGYRQFNLRKKMQSLALTDELTKLPNRRHIMSYAELQFQQALAMKQAFSVITFDVDHFKHVNDNFGHAAGDAVLQRIAAAIPHIGRTQDRIGRTGGEEFMMILPGANADTAVLVAERLRATIRDIDWRDIHPKLSLSISLGVSALLPEDANEKTVILRADNALYEAKRNGRNRVELHAASIPLAFISAELSP